MKGNSYLVPAILIVSAVLFVSGVVKKIRASEKTERGKVIAVIPKGTANMWWNTVYQGALKAAEKHHCRIIWSGPETETDRERQIQTVDDVLIQKVDAVVLGPNDFKALARSVGKIADKKIPCIIIDSPVNSDRYDAFAGTDNYAGGAHAARILGKAIGGSGKVILMHYIQNSASTEERARGFKETLKKEFPGISLAAEQYNTLGTVEDARQKTADMLTKNSDVKGVFAVNHPSSVGAYKALQANRLAGKVRYVGFDSDPVLLEGIDRGEVDALVVQNPFEIGYRGVVLAMDKLAGKPVARNNKVPSMIVDRKNLEEMKKNFPSALGL